MGISSYVTPNIPGLTSAQANVHITGNMAIASLTPGGGFIEDLVSLYSLLAITTQSLPDAVSMQPYATALSATGGVAPIYWSLASAPSLPTGFSLSGGGILSSTGNPAATPGIFVYRCCD